MKWFHVRQVTTKQIAPNLFPKQHGVYNFRATGTLKSSSSCVKHVCYSISNLESKGWKETLSEFIPSFAIMYDIVVFPNYICL